MSNPCLGPLALAYADDLALVVRDIRAALQPLQVALSIIQHASVLTLNIEKCEAILGG